ncbi:hypothetical protein QJS10_CPA16g00763 [Acorus calamus]|uniref:Uncharacterized protein n=1 Tax=Acorus calamus TaxID=4465 RepID=A0AAV9D1H9_ACOCL|nr:hypothetical protein QJS10_CPA16g00763 [Acorus calamus]
MHAKMQPHARLNSAMAKKLWNHIRVSFIMARKGLVSKRKLLMDLNLMIKRGKLFRKTFFNLTFQTHHHHHHYLRAGWAGPGLGPAHRSTSSRAPTPLFFRPA